MSAVPLSALRHAGFASLPYGAPEDARAGALAVLGVPREPLPGRRTGTTAGPLAIREAIAELLAPFKASPSRSVVDLERRQVVTLRDPLAGVDLGDLAGDAGTEGLADLVAELAARNAVPVVLGGASDLVGAFSRAFAWLVVVSDRLTIPGPDGSPGPLDALLPAGSVSAIGTCGLQPAAARSVPFVAADQLHDAHDMDGLVIDAARPAEPFAVVLDAAVIDGGHAAGTPEPVMGGLSPSELERIARTLGAAGAIAGVAVVNVAPSLDPRGHTEHAMGRALLALLAPHLVDEVPA